MEDSELSVTNKSDGEKVSKENYVYRLLRCARRGAVSCGPDRQDCHRTVLLKGMYIYEFVDI